MPGKGLRGKVKLVAFYLLAIQLGSVKSFDFGFSSIVSNISTGTANVAKASVGAIASIPEIAKKPFSATDNKDDKSIEKETETQSSVTEYYDVDNEDNPKTTFLVPSDLPETPESIKSTPVTEAILPSSTESANGNGKEKVGTTTVAAGSWIPSVIKTPVDAVASIPKTVASGAGEAWRTVSETVVNQDPEHSVKFYLYDNPENLTEFKQIVVGQPDTLRSVNIPKGSRLNILIHGFMQDINSSFLQDMKDTFLLHNGDPVICVDWGHMADGKFGPEVARTLLYPFIVDNVATVGEYVGDFIVFLKNNSAIYTLDQVHVLGFSLGAHVSGIAGWTVQNRTDGEKIARITGLDPAGPKFFLKTKERRLNHDDAKFVDVIHTSHLGYFLQMGHIDFFPNGGKIQPGCIETESGVTDTVTSLGSLLTGSCSHERAWKYYTRSIKDNELFGCECNNIFKYELTGCEAECEDKVPFGELCPKSARGNYFLSI